MSTLSVPLTPIIEQMIERLVADGVSDSKAGVVRKAVVKYIEDQAVFAVLEAEQEINDGKILTGDLDELAARL